MSDHMNRNQINVINKSIRAYGENDDDKENVEYVQHNSVEVRDERLKRKYDDDRSTKIKSITKKHGRSKTLFKNDLKDKQTQYVYFPVTSSKVLLHNDAKNNQRNNDNESFNIETSKIKYKKDVEDSGILCNINRIYKKEFSVNELNDMRTLYDVHNNPSYVSELDGICYKQLATIMHNHSRESLQLKLDRTTKVAFDYSYNEINELIQNYTDEQIKSIFEIKARTLNHWKSQLSVNQHAIGNVYPKQVRIISSDELENESIEEKSVVFHQLHHKDASYRKLVELIDMNDYNNSNFIDDPNEYIVNFALYLMDNGWKFYSMIKCSTTKNNTYCQLSLINIVYSISLMLHYRTYIMQHSKTGIEKFLQNYQQNFLFKSKIKKQYETLLKDINTSHYMLQLLFHGYIRGNVFIPKLDNETYEMMLEKVKNQKMVCYYTGLEINQFDCGSPLQGEKERTDSNLGYFNDEQYVVMASKFANQLKGSMTEDEFNDYLDSIIAFYKEEDGTLNYDKLFSIADEILEKYISTPNNQKSNVKQKNTGININKIINKNENQIIIKCKFRSMRKRKQIERKFESYEVLIKLYHAFGGRCMVTGIPISKKWVHDIGFDRFFDNNNYCVEGVLLMLCNINLAKNCGGNEYKMNIFKDSDTFREFMKMNMHNHDIGFDQNKDDIFNVIKYVRYLFKSLIDYRHKKNQSNNK